MILGSERIAAAIDQGRIVLSPFDRRFLRPASYLMRLGRRWRLASGQGEVIDSARPVAEQAGAPVIIESDTLTIQAGDLIVAETLEAIGMPDDLAGQLSTLSHLARLGVAVHLASNWINPGFGGATPTKLALEITCASPFPVILHTGWPLCHVAFLEVGGATTVPQGRRSPFEGADPLAFPRYAEEFAPLCSAGSAE
jgi:dCTP deaminase